MASLINNGGFETGDLTGWTHYLTPNGTDDFGDVASFDTTGSGASLAARFEVGRVSGGTSEGAGISQSVFLSPGTYTLTADIASDFSAENIQGGVFSILLDGSPIDTFDFGDIANTTERSSRSVSVLIGAGGSYLLAFQFVRGAATLGDTPDNYIDNIQLVSDVPEPATWLLTALGLGCLMAVRRRAQSQKWYAREDSNL